MCAFNFPVIISVCRTNLYTVVKGRNVEGVWRRVNRAADPNVWTQQWKVIGLICPSGLAVIFSVYGHSERL